MKIETQEQFDEYIGVEIPSALFHVMPTDLDDATGAKREDIILLEMIAEHPEILKFKPLSWFVEYFITSFSQNNK